jgi:hypothetical protein
MVDTSIIGREIETVRFPVERSKVREFARALGDHDALYESAAVARAAGYAGIPAPLTFSVAAMHWRPVIEDEVISGLGLDLRRVLHGEVSWEYLGEISVGDELIGRRRVVDVTTRDGTRGGSMVLVHLETEYTNQEGVLVLRQRDTLIEAAASAGQAA